MQFVSLTQDPNLNPHPKFIQKLENFKLLLGELEIRNIPLSVVGFINSEIASFNKKDIRDTKLHKHICFMQRRILKKLERQLKIVPKNYYRNLWMILGMSCFGIPMGAAFGTTIGHLSYLGIGLPIGMAIGIAVGSTLDKKAAAEGRQLNFNASL